MTEALREAHQATAEAAALLPAGQATVQEEAQAIAEEAQVEAVRAEAHHPAEEDLKGFKNEKDITYYTFSSICSNLRTRSDCIRRPPVQREQL